RMLLMPGMDLPVRAIREQMTSAFDLVVHQTRFKDGSRHVTQITEIEGIEGETIALQDLFRFVQALGLDDERGQLKASCIRPGLLDKLLWRGSYVDPGLFQDERFHV